MAVGQSLTFLEIPGALPQSGFAPGYDEYGPRPICIAVVVCVTGESDSARNKSNMSKRYINTERLAGQR
jgi:hypothetical protein